MQGLPPEQLQGTVQVDPARRQDRTWLSSRPSATFTMGTRGSFLTTGRLPLGGGGGARPEVLGCGSWAPGAGCGSSSAREGCGGLSRGRLAAPARRSLLRDTGSGSCEWAACALQAIRCNPVRGCNMGRMLVNCTSATLESDLIGHCAVYAACPPSFNDLLTVAAIDVGRRLENESLCLEFPIQALFCIINHVLLAQNG